MEEYDKESKEVKSKNPCKNKFEAWDRLFSEQFLVLPQTGFSNI